MYLLKDTSAQVWYPPPLIKNKQTRMTVMIGGSRHIKQALAKFRISAHCSEIERGRYCRPLVPSEKRLCKFCSQNVCDDKCHFLISCDFLYNERSYLFKDIMADNKNVADLSNIEKTLYLAKSSGKIAFKVTKFCYISFDGRGP